MNFKFRFQSSVFVLSNLDVQMDSSALQLIIPSSAIARSRPILAAKQQGECVEG